MSKDDDDALVRLTAKMKKGEVVSLDELLRVAQPEAEVVKPTTVPALEPMDDEDRIVVAKLPEVYARVRPAVRRKLEEWEIADLIEERRVLKAVEKLVQKGVEDIKHIILNHMDVGEEERAEGDDPGLPYNDDGHYIPHAKVQVGAPGTKKKFSWEPRPTKPSISLMDLVAAEEAGDITHKEFLAMTAQRREFDQTKFMAAVAKDPTLIQRLRKHIKPGGRTAALYVR